MDVLVTGGAHGIGRSTAKKLEEEGHSVTVVDIDEEGLEEVPRGIETFVLDVRREDDVEKFLSEREFDVVVNNAGFQKQGALEDMDSESFERHFETNVFGAANIIRHSMDFLKDNDGRIVNVGSVAGFLPLPFMSGYCSSKYALRGLTQSLRVELRGFDVDVVLVEPGEVSTGFNEEGVRGINDYLEDSDFEDVYRRKLDQIEDMGGISPDKAGNTVLKAVTDVNPDRVYRVPFSSSFYAFLESISPECLKEFLVGRREGL